MKNLKRNLIIATVLLFVCAAVYLNWSYNNKWGTPDSDMVLAEDEFMGQAEEAAAEDANLPAEGTGLVDRVDGAETETNEYFASARLTRQQSRDEALGLLQMAAASEYASPEVVDNAMNEISAMAARTMREAQLENMLLARDFTDCVVFLTDYDVTVAVPSPEEGLSEASVARISEAISGETGYDATQICIIEIKD